MKTETIKLTQSRNEKKIIFSQESRRILQDKLKKINPDIGGFNGYDGPTGNDSSGANGSDREIRPEEIEKIFGYV